MLCFDRTHKNCDQNCSLYYIYLDFLIYTYLRDCIMSLLEILIKKKKKERKKNDQNFIVDVNRVRERE